MRYEEIHQNQHEEKPKHTQRNYYKNDPPLEPLEPRGRRETHFLRVDFVKVDNPPHVFVALIEQKGTKQFDDDVDDVHNESVAPVLYHGAD